MSDLKMDLDGDLDVTDGEVTLVIDEEAIAQHLKIRLRTYRGEWFLDTREGIPYKEFILVKNPNRLIVESIFREVIVGTPGIKSLNSFSLDIDGTTRALTLSFTATFDNGLPLVFEELLINI